MNLKFLKKDTKKTIRSLNIDFHEKRAISIFDFRHEDRDLMNTEFYRIMEKKEINYRKSILLEIFPDSGDTFAGELISQYGKVLKFDLDVFDENYFEVHDITDQYKPENRKNVEDVPWFNAMAGFELFHELHR